MRIISAIFAAVAIFGIIFAVIYLAAPAASLLPDAPPLKE